MENKQTAINWIESKLNSVKPTDFCSIETIRDWINQAKAMEKEQIMKAFDINYDYPDGIAASERYYKRKYGSI